MWDLRATEQRSRAARWARCHRHRCHRLWDRSKNAANKQGFSPCLFLLTNIQEFLKGMPTDYWREGRAHSPVSEKVYTVDSTSLELLAHAFSRLEAVLQSFTSILRGSTAASDLAGLIRCAPAHTGVEMPSQVDWHASTASAPSAPHMCYSDIVSSHCLLKLLGATHTPNIRISYNCLFSHPCRPIDQRTIS